MSNSTEQEATNDLQGVVDRNAGEAEVEQNEKAAAAGAVAAPEQSATQSRIRDDSVKGSNSNRGRCQKWTDAINCLRAPILTALHYITHRAASNPKRTILAVPVVSIALLMIGLATNYNMEGEEDRLWTPVDTKADVHGRWINDESGFPDVPRPFYLFFHNNGGNVLLLEDDDVDGGKGGAPPMRHIFNVLDAVRELPDYGQVCAESLYVDPQTNRTDCRVWGVTKFWNHSVDALNNDTDWVASMSAPFFPDGSFASEETLYGYPSRNDGSGRLESVQSYMVLIDLPDTDASETFEEEAIDVVLEWDNSFQADPDVDFHVEISAFRSFEDEFNRAILVDIPLIPLVFVIMSSFAMAVFFRRDRLYSRSFLGFCGVICVLLSLSAGYGLMFVIGITLTSMTQILPFIVFGIGLDDVFILTCSYDRTDRNKNPVERIHDTIDDVGLSITMTSLTSAMAFALGSISSIPAIRWLCVYGYPTIILVFLYQLTFFIACMVLDEDRIQARRRDCCCCRSVVAIRDDREGGGSEQPRNHFVDNLMSRYATVLLRPTSKVLVTIGFMALAGGLAYSTSKLKQAFEPKDLLPSDSYLREFWDALDEYQARSFAAPFAYFRYVDQSNATIQQQMNNYINALVSLDSIEDPPDSFWLWDFYDFVGSMPLSANTNNQPFSELMDLFLAQPAYYEMYNDHIVRDSQGNVMESRALLFMDGVSWDDIRGQIDALEDQRSLTASQPVNQGQSDWRFFTYFDGYDIWELYRVSVEELIKTTIIGVGAVTGIALLLIPHWSAFLIVLPSITVLYIELLGFMQLAGLSINPISYIGLVMSIGLLVDFVMHILLRYYESEGNRTKKTINTLKTMGSSIFLGGTSSLLGTLPLAFSTSEMFFNIFIVFFGLVVLGTAHGLILLPVILSTVGPEDPPVKSSNHYSRQAEAGAATSTDETNGITH